MASFTITIPDTDVPRIQAALPASQTPKQYVIGCLIALVQSYETQQHQQQYAASYTPIGGS